MTAVVWGFALLAGALHVLVFAWEALLFERPGVHQGVFGTATRDVAAVRLWAFGVGFYNLFLAAGIVTGVAVWAAGEVAVGRALVVYVCLFMLASAVVLFVADRRALSRPRGTGVGGALAQGTPPLLALVAATL
jgi:putative membrane protein